MEAGAASEIAALVETGGVSLAPEQQLLTPFQRMVIILQVKRRNEEMEKERGNQSLNSARQPKGGTMSGETTTYVNKNA